MWWLPWFLLAFSTRLSGVRSQGNPPLQIDNVVDVGPFVDTELCYEALIQADEDMDRRVDRDEYVTFVQLLGPDGFLEDISSFAELPVLLRLNFNTLACLCQNQPGAAGDCCVGDNAHISNEGAAQGEDPTNAQTAYLFTVCLFTEASIERILESETPSASPTEMPSFSPTLTPTGLSEAPSQAPSLAPSLLEPSEAPSSVPSNLEPSSFPSELPTETPGLPSSSPTSMPTATPTGSPAPTLTPAPTMKPGDFVIEQPYQIAVEGAVEPSVYVQDLIDSMDIVATDVANDLFRRLLLRRRLTVTVEIPTTLFPGFEILCPAGVPSTTQCREVQASVKIQLEGEEDNDATVEAYTKALNASVFDGDLQDALETVDPDSPVRIISGAILDATEPPTPSPASSTSGISNGAIAGIVIAGVVVWVGIAGYFVMRKRRQEKDYPYFPSESETDKGGATTLGAVSPDYGKSPRDFQSLEGDTAMAVAGASKKSGDDSSSNAGSSGWSSSAGVSSLNTGSVDSVDYEKPAGAATLAAIGAASAVAQDRSKSAQKIEEGDVPDLPEVTREDLDTAIEAGDWAAVGATAALLAAASESQSYSSRSRKSGESTSKGTTVSSIDAARAAELDHLVDAGDWEGVVLAAARFEKSEGDSSTSKSGSGSKTTASQSRSATGSGASYTAGSSRSATGSVGTSSAYSQGASTSLSESPSKAAKRAEIRQEVEALVRRVVPDEIDNVDEMMLQFKGREEELVETLRTMQERSIAQRARAAERKSAKIQARNDVRQARAAEGGAAAVAGAAPSAAAVGAAPSAPATEGGGGLSEGAIAGIAAGGAVVAAGVAAAVGAASREKDEKEEEKGPMHEKDEAAVPPLAAESESKSKPEEITKPTGESESKKRRTALEMAIEAGDWEAVGEAAAMMSDASASSRSGAETGSIGSGSTRSGKRQRTGVNAARAEELDRMIDKGDWTGVVQAASAFSQSDKTKDDSRSLGSGSASGSQRQSWFGKKKSGEGEESVDSSKAKALKEEQDALAQAEVWMAIAEQSKTEGTGEAAGASDAADWAIARSLSALRHAEAGGELKADSSRRKGTTSSGASVGEGSSTGDKSV